MIQVAKRRQRELLLTTLIDLLVQILFVFLLAIIVITPNDGTLTIVRQARQLAKETGKTLTELRETWRRLIDPDSLDKKQKKLLADAANYERLKQLEQELIEKQRDEKKKTDELQEQLKYYQERFRALGDPPCMFSDANSSRPAPLFLVRIRDDGLEVMPRWPRSKDDAASVLPIPKDSLKRPINIAEFQRGFKPIYEKSRVEGCRHYVILEDSSTSAPRSNAHRAAVEGYFYLMGSAKRQ